MEPRPQVDVWTRPLEILAVAAGFVLLVAAVWFPWFREHLVHGRGVPFRVSTALSNGDIAITDGAGRLLPLYFIGSAAVLVLCAVTVFGSPTIRRVCAPTAAGVLAGQALLVFAIIHTRGVPTDEAVSLPTGVAISRTFGAYVAVLALALFAMALAPALHQQGYLFDRDTLRRSIGQLTGRAPHEEEIVSDDLRRPSELRNARASEQRVELASVQPGFVAVPETGAAAQLDGSAPPDHSAYRRPQIIASHGASQV